MDASQLREIARISFAPMHHRKAFTLIELLVVIAIIAVIAIVVVVTLSPGQLIQQSRDSNRLSDLANIQTAVNLFLTDQPGGNIGSSSVVYVSIPDPVATSTAGDQCQGLGLSSLPSGYSYHCAASSTIRNANGQGWIPVNLASISVGSPLSALPQDPTNSSSSHLYYTYTTNGNQYEVTAALESQKYKLGGSNDVVGTDGSSLSTVYAKGTNLSLEPLDYGDSALVGYWTFDEGTLSTAYDYSGNNATGSWAGAQAGMSGYYSPGKIGAWAGYFNGSTSTTDGVDITNPANRILPQSNQSFSIALWVNPNNLTGLTGNREAIMTNETYLTSGFRMAIGNCNTACVFQFWSSESGGSFNDGGGPTATINTWYQVVATYNGSLASLYVNGSIAATSTGAYIGNTNTLGLANYNFGYSSFAGLLDDVRIYNRALSTAEIQAMYNGGK
jgi:prepilin-type N-terminal cleavage/methylation domain-containing protein